MFTMGVSSIDFSDDDNDVHSTRSMKVPHHVSFPPSWMILAVARWILNVKFGDFESSCSELQAGTPPC